MSCPVFQLYVKLGLSTICIVAVWFKQTVVSQLELPLILYKILYILKFLSTPIKTPYKGFDFFKRDDGITHWYKRIYLTTCSVGPLKQIYKLRGDTSILVSLFALTSVTFFNKIPTRYRNETQKAIVAQTIISVTGYFFSSRHYHDDSYRGKFQTFLNKVFRSYQ